MNRRDKEFSENELRGERVDGDKFGGCRFVGANLKFSAFTKCVFENCSFPGSKLSNLDLSPAVFIKCDFANSVIENGVFQKLKSGPGNETIRYDLRECNFGNASLLNTIWIKCDLSETSFEGSNLTGAVFDRCKLRKVKFGGAEISGVSFEGSTIDQTELDTNGFVQYSNSRGFKLC
jgi:uncharacterized protein YjbI with pentapeptide repeats